MEKVVKLCPGTHCGECFYGGLESLSGAVDCEKQDEKKCKQGKTVYKEVPMTRADQIRNMNDEELAWYLLSVAEAGALRYNFSFVEQLDWLRKEVKDDCPED